MMNIGNHSYNRDPRIRIVAKLNPPPDRIAIREEYSGQGLINDRHAGGSAPVALVKKAPANKPGLQGFKVVGTYRCGHDHRVAGRAAFRRQAIENWPADSYP